MLRCKDLFTLSESERKSEIFLLFLPPQSINSTLIILSIYLNVMSLWSSLSLKQMSLQ